jgi:alkanesulfonate monooxygenase SsuD/methylene tetrahydromethanopterin reductase-like flavin-dependent oxidoreductase (luciferase family)
MEQDHPVSSPGAIGLAGQFVPSASASSPHPRATPSSGSAGPNAPVARLRHPGDPFQQLLSGGRFELGIGAGRPDAAAENRLLGLPVDYGAVRVARLAESIGIVKALLAAGSGRQLLSLAAREADISGPGLPPETQEAAVSERIDWIREAAGDRFAEIELNLNLMAVGDQVPRWIAARLRLSDEFMDLFAPVVERLAGH